MPHHQGWLYLVDRDTGQTMELFNHARTIEGLKLAAAAGDVTGFYDIGVDTICESYYWVPDCLTGDPLPVVFALPSTVPEAPWYDPAFPISADAYGFIVEEWTGLDSSNVSSASSAVAFAGGGSSVGPRAAGGKTQSINVFLIGRSDEGLEHLFRWLESMLNSVCDPSSSIDMLFRRYCPETITDAWNGIGRIEKVAAVGGLTLEAPPTSDRYGGCKIRKANFTIEAQDPCIYIDHTVTAVVGAFDPDQGECDELGHATCTPRCADADAFPTLLETVYVEALRPSIGALAPVIQLDLTPENGVIFGGPTLVQIYADTDGSGIFSCSLPLIAEFGVRTINPTEEIGALTLIYDGARRDIFERRPSSYGVSTGWSWTVPTESGVPRWSARRCRGFHVAVMPLAPCDFDKPPAMDITVTLGERISCP